MKNEFTLQDFVAMQEQIRSPGLLTKAIVRLTGPAQVLKHLEVNLPDLERHKAQVRAIYHAMTPEQQAAPDAIDSSARRQIATRAGLDIMDVSRFLDDFHRTRAVLERVAQRNAGPSPTQVLGLVTDDRHHRDPSFLLKPVPRRDVLFWILFPIAAAVGILLYRWLFPALYR